MVLLKYLNHCRSSMLNKKFDVKNQLCFPLKLSRLYRNKHQTKVPDQYRVNFLMADGIFTVNQCFVPKSREDEEEIEKCYKKYTEFVSTLPKEKGWGTEFLYEYKGSWFPLPAIEGLLWMQDGHFKAKASDIFLMTHPKCGTTWLKALIFSIMNRTQFDFFTHPLLKHNPHQLVPFLEFELFGCPPLGDPEIMPSPRILATHLPYTLLPKTISESDSKIVYISRDPKDVFVSMWPFFNKMRETRCGLPPVPPLEEAFDLFCKGISPRGPYWDHVLGYWRASLECPENVLLLKYEALQEDMVGHVKKLADFLGCPFTVDEQKNGVVQEIVKLCSFESLSNMEVNKTGHNFHNLEYNIFFRKGKMRDYENYLTSEMMERINKVTEEKLNSTGFTFQV